MLLRLFVALAFLVPDIKASFRDFGIPSSLATVQIRVFNVANLTIVNAAHTLVLPHTASKRRLMFDLGMRNDTENFAPSVSAFFSSGTIRVDPFKDITGLLEDGGIPLSSIETVIWSHSHFDHIGDMSKFPPTTNLLIGPGTNTALFPDSPDGALQTSDFAGRNVTGLNFNSTSLTFSGLKAIDYFGDGSFYLLNTPGHQPGHITALARVTPTSFILLGGDTAHHVGQLRPRPHFQKNFPCPAHLLEETKSSVSTDYFWSWGSKEHGFDLRSRSQSLFSVSNLPDSFYADPNTALVSQEKIATFDADADFFVIIAHDLTLVPVLPYFPSLLNDWQKKQLKARSAWSFIDQSNPAFMFHPVNQTAEE
ncbi:beta-lactamase-like protein [Mycena rebaudengoi]|nr:beta-lactamase-like protein [Mycena rebaudengoi]